MKIISRFIIIIPVITLLAAGCNQTLNTSTSPSPESQTAVVDNLNLQSECAAQAERALSDFEQTGAANDYKSYNQQNHYNQKLNKCFVLIDYTPDFSTYIGDSSNKPTRYEDLLDAYENNDLASCTFFENKPPYFDSSNDICSIGNNYNETFQQYSDFVNQRMELNSQN